MTDRFMGKVALVTAAASGIGAATARRLARDGAAVMLSDIDVEGGEAIAADIRAAGGDARFRRADATREADVAALVSATIERFGGLHIAANIVGDSMGDAKGPDMHLKSVEGWDDTFAVCLRSTFLGLKHEIGHMIDHGGGAIVNIASLAAIKTLAKSGAAYSTAKAGVLHLTRWTAVQYADRGVRVNCIAPGVTPTAAYYRNGADVAEAAIEKMLENQPIRRIISADEQAATIAWLCSEEASMITGHNIPVDGGWAAQ